MKVHEKLLRYSPLFGEQESHTHGIDAKKVRALGGSGQSSGV